MSQKSSRKKKLAKNESDQKTAQGDVNGENGSVAITSQDEKEPILSNGAEKLHNLTAEELNDLSQLEANESDFLKNLKGIILPELQCQEDEFLVSKSIKTDLLQMQVYLEMLRKLKHLTDQRIKDINIEVQRKKGILATNRLIQKNLKKKEIEEAVPEEKKPDLSKFSKMTKYMSPKTP